MFAATMDDQASNQHNPEYLDDPSKYFSMEEWHNLSRYEKIRIQNTYEIYVEMVKSGFHMSKPDFMTRKSETNKDQEKLNDNKLKRKNAEVSEKTRKKRATTKVVNEKKSRYPKRNQPPKNYTEADIIPDDYYIYCEVCMNEFLDDCKIHTPTFVSDTPIPLDPENPDRARQTVPEGWLTVSSSKIRDGGEGVWALRKITKGIRFGPYEGIYTEQNEDDGQYSWQIKRDGKVICYIDGQDTSKSNWMRYVNCARYKAEQNLTAYQYRGKIYYRVVTDIDPGTELFVFYGPQFARELGIDTKNYKSPPKTSLGDKIFECKTCHLAFSNPIYLENHIPRCRDKKVAGTKIQQQNTDTVDSTSNNESYKCHLCDKIYTIKTLYRHHLLRSHYIYSDLLNNENTRSENTETNEASCDRSYTEELKEKCRQRKYKCNQCNKAFQWRSHLEIHSRIHSGDRPYKCETCKKTFTQQSDLNKHILIHTDERPHVCEICHKAFNFTSNLIVHKRTHNKTRPYQCPKCNKTFTLNNSLTEHIRIHTGIKPYHCKLCTYQATNSSHLTYHMRTHTGDRPYTCKHCQKAFTTSGSLKRHIVKLHPNEEHS